MNQIVISDDMCVGNHTLRAAPVRRKAACGKRSEILFV